MPLGDAQHQPTADAIGFRDRDSRRIGQSHGADETGASIERITQFVQ